MSGYRHLRKGTIGSEYHSIEIEEIYEYVNPIAKKTFKKLAKVEKSKAKSVLRYFYDLDLTVQQIKKIVKKHGCVALVIGNTSYKGIKIDNAKILAQSLIEHGFNNLRASKRKISYKNLTPYRDEKGCFTTHAKGKKVYSHEYILTCEK